MPLLLDVEVCKAIIPALWGGEWGSGKSRKTANSSPGWARPVLKKKKKKKKVLVYILCKQPSGVILASPGK
jgi:hypothetical protein